MFRHHRPDLVVVAGRELWNLGIQNSQEQEMMQFTAKEIADMVAMPILLRELGFQVNMRTRRCRCILHGGGNTTTFSWGEGGLWHCFSCGQGGDKFTLVQRVRDCGFREALQFIGELAGIEVGHPPPAQRRAWARQRQERQREQQRAKKLAAAKLMVMLKYRDEIHWLERLQGYAATRLHELHCGKREQLSGGEETAWSALSFVESELPQAVAGYTIAAFGSEADKLRFATKPAQRRAMIQNVILADGVTDDCGRFMELL